MKILFASNNKNKIKEVREVLKEFKIFSLEDVGYTKDIEEFGETFEQNALIKAQTLAKKYKNHIIIADDSGLCVEDLEMEPGVYSKRYASDSIKYMSNIDDANNLKLLEKLKNKSNRNAFYITILCLIVPNQSPIFIEGKVCGEISTKYEYVEDSFGYDTIFKYKEKLFSELTTNEKNEISHRGKALKQLKIKLKKYIK